MPNDPNDELCDDVPLADPGFALMLDRLAKTIPHRSTDPVCDPQQARIVLQTLLAECAHVAPARITPDAVELHLGALRSAWLLYDCVSLRSKREGFAFSERAQELVRELHGLDIYDRRTADADGRNVLRPPKTAPPPADHDAADLPVRRSMAALLRENELDERLFTAAVNELWQGDPAFDAEDVRSTLRSLATDYLGGADTHELGAVIRVFVSRGWLEAVSFRTRVDTYDLTPEGRAIAGITPEEES